MNDNKKTIKPQPIRSIEETHQKELLTCNWLSSFRSVFDFGPGISVFTEGQAGSFITYELYKHRASVTGINIYVNHRL